MTLLLLQSGPGRAGGIVVGPPPEPEEDLHINNVVLLMSFGNMIDESPSLHGEAVVIGSAAIDATQSVFGGSSLKLDGLGEIAFPDSDDFNLGNADFTIECWIRPTTVVGIHDIIGQWEDLTSNLGWILSQNGATLQLNVSTSGLDDIAVIATGSVLTAGAWHAIAVDFDGTKYRLYVNGVMGGSSTTLHTIHDSSYELSIGGTVSSPFVGWIDELRITRVARYHSDSGYTVASSPYPRPPVVLTLSNSVIAKNASVGTTIGTLLVSGGTGSYTFTLTSNPGGLFAISGANLNVAASLTGGSKPITVEATGGTPSPVTQAFTVTVAALTLSGSTIQDDALVGDTVGTLAVSGGTGLYTYTLTSDPSGLFVISGSDLDVAAALTAGSYPITVAATGGMPALVSDSFMVTVTVSLAARSAMLPSAFVNSPGTARVANVGGVMVNL